MMIYGRIAILIVGLLSPCFGQTQVDVNTQKLIDVLKNNRPFSDIDAKALANAGPVVLPILIRELNSPNIDIRKKTLMTISYMGPSGKGAIPDLLRLARDKKSSVAYEAIAALRGIGLPAAPALESLTTSGDAEIAALAIGAGNSSESGQIMPKAFDRGGPNVAADATHDGRPLNPLVAGAILLMWIPALLIEALIVYARRKRVDPGKSFGNFIVLNFTLTLLVFCLLGLGVM
jgi:hypothetical protein